jgi:hypothetical protein
MSLLQTSRPLEKATTNFGHSAKGGPGIRTIHDACSQLPRSRGSRYGAEATTSRTGRGGALLLIQVLPFHEKGRGTWFIDALDKALATVPFPGRGIG